MGRVPYRDVFTGSFNNESLETMQFFFAEV